MLLFTVAPGPLWLLPMQALSGIDAAVLGILSPLIIADVTAGSGRYNLAQGAVGMTTGIGAALSTTAIGYIAQWFGFTAGLLVLAAVASGGLRVHQPAAAGEPTGRGRMSRHRLLQSDKAASIAFCG